MAKKAKALRTAPKAKKVKRAGVQERREAFVEAYIANGCNGTQAAIKAGYAVPGAYQEAYRLLRNAEVQQMLETRRAELAKALKLETHNVIAACAAIIYADLSKVVDEFDRPIPLRAWPPEMRAALAGVDFADGGVGIEKIRLSDRNAAIDKAMKHLGLFEKDNNQKADPFAQFMAHVAEHNKPVPVRP